MRKIVRIESFETKLQLPTQDYAEWLMRVSESSEYLDRTMETNPLDVVAASAANIAWAVNMAKNFQNTLQEFLDPVTGGDKLKLLGSALGLLGSLATGLWTVRDKIRKLGVAQGKPGKP